MSRLRVGSLSNPFAKSGETSKPMRPSADRSQSALLPLQTINTESGDNENDNEGEVPGSAQTASVSGPTTTTKRNRAHTVAVALGPPRREGLRRGSSSSNPRRLEEGRGEREGSPVHFELGNDHEDLNDEVVGMLDVVDPEVSTGTFLPTSKSSLLTSSEPPSERDQLYHHPSFPSTMVSATRS
jgi:hypothetical protein